jgi:hypothetical protein
MYSGGLIRHGDRSSGTDLHASVIECIRRRDSDAAGAAMTMLLREAERDLQAWVDSQGRDPSSVTQTRMLCALPRLEPPDSAGSVGPVQLNDG